MSPCVVPLFRHQHLRDCRSTVDGVRPAPSSPDCGDAERSLEGQWCVVYSSVDISSGSVVAVHHQICSIQVDSDFRRLRSIQPRPSPASSTVLLVLDSILRDSLAVSVQYLLHRLLFCGCDYKAIEYPNVTINQTLAYCLMLRPIGPLTCRVTARFGLSFCSALDAMWTYYQIIWQPVQRSSRDR